jgi:hypothetical protein
MTTLEKIQIHEDGYEPVECDPPLPCPFCGGNARLGQVKRTASNFIIMASSSPIRANVFWFECAACGAKSGKHQSTPQDAANTWNRREGQG